LEDHGKGGVFYQRQLSISKNGNMGKGKQEREQEHLCELQVTFFFFYYFIWHTFTAMSIFFFILLRVAVLVKAGGGHFTHEKEFIVTKEASKRATLCGKQRSLFFFSPRWQAALLDCQKSEDHILGRFI
jgi:hypothetical protein